VLKPHLAHPRPPPHQQPPAQLRYIFEIDTPYNRCQHRGYRRTSAAGTRESSDESLVVSPCDFLERLFRFRSERRRVRQRRLPCRLRWPARRGSRYSPRRPALRRPRLPQILSPLPTANFQTYTGAAHPPARLLLACRKSTPFSFAHFLTLPPRPRCPQTNRASSAHSLISRAHHHPKSATSSPSKIRLSSAP
jgi:hypothetical protein